MKIGKSKHGGSRKNFFKLAKGEGIVGVYRFLPPLGDAADEGLWTAFYRVHYGYKNSEGRMKPFQSCEKVNFSNKMVEVVDAAKQRIKMLEAKAVELKAALKTAEETGTPNPAAVENLATVRELLKRYNLEGKWYMNAIDLSGAIGLAKIPHKAKQLLENLIKELEAKGVDPTGVEDGRFFEIIRTGNNNTTVYSVRLHTKTIQHPELGEIQQPVKHALDESILARLGNEAHNLKTLFKAPTAEQVARIVKEGVPAVDAILGVGQKGGTASDGGGGDDGEDVPEQDDVDGMLEEAAKGGTKAASSLDAALASSATAAPAVSAPVTTAAPAAAAPKAAAPAATVTAPLTSPATPAAAPAAGVKIGKATVAAAASETAKTSAAAVTNMSKDEFLNMLENT